MAQFLHEVWRLLVDFWPHFVAAAILFSSLFASAHAVLHKRDTCATIGWVGLIWLSPIFGVALYFLFGVNRIKRRAVLLRSGQLRSEPPASAHVCPPELLDEKLGLRDRHMATLAELVGRLTSRPLLHGNAIEPLDGGDRAYPAMLAAIDSATRSIALMTYIFDNDRVGRQFVAALHNAVARGVEVRVLIDDIGSRYSIPSIIGALAKAGVRVERFLPLVRARLPFLCQPAKPPQDSGRRRPDRLHRRHEHPRGNDPARWRRSIACKTCISA